MTDTNYEYWQTDRGRGVKAWTRGVTIEPEARKQAYNLANLPFIHKHVALMPDAHMGKGSTVGSVIATKGAIIPAAVGVDIGCGMMALRTNYEASDLPDNLSAIRSDLEKAIPHGRTNNGGKGDRGAWGEQLPDTAIRKWNAGLEKRYREIGEKHPGAMGYNHVNHMGTLGTGNHFVELCLDQDGRLWIMLHSGSRGAGNRIGTYFIEKAKREMERWHIAPYLEDKDLSYLVENTELFDDYVEAVSWAQDFALANREVMMDAAKWAVYKHLSSGKKPVGGSDIAVNCHHNYATMENHFGANVWVTRKGAVRARLGDLGIIPGSMGAKSFIVRGKGNADSFHSCSHGAGRKMSRTEARKRFTVQDHELATMGVECRKDDGVLDETPGAYKDIDAVMAAQSDLVEVVHTLRQVVCVKG